MERELVFWGFVVCYLLAAWVVGLAHHYAMIRWCGERYETRAFWAALIWPLTLVFWALGGVAVLVLSTVDMVEKAALR